MAVYPQLGPACAFFLASGTFFLASVTIGATSETFLNYGWRLPFIASLLLVMVGLWIRLSIEETPSSKPPTHQGNGECTRSCRSLMHSGSSGSRS